ncbi:hypothetical protein [uncultured Helicobacter sp.]|uniref:hypothetical protein n=1 Tax=uncultured Helicobacter sp. TaxID=175537 RepID=UPI0026058214|nr:hypothetical protein [uncultured Helicobacter sp.]
MWITLRVYYEHFVQVINCISKSANPFIVNGKCMLGNSISKLLGMWLFSCDLFYISKN